MLVDDSLDFLHAARTLLEQEGLQIIGIASTGADALARATELRPDVTLLDVELGKPTASNWRDSWPTTRTSTPVT